MRDLRVDLVMAVEGALRTEEAGGLVDAIVGASEDSIIDWGFSFRNILVWLANPIGSLIGGKVEK